MSRLGGNCSFRTCVATACGLLTALFFFAHILSSGSKAPASVATHGFNRISPSISNNIDQPLGKPPVKKYRKPEWIPDPSTMQFWRTYGRLHGLPTEEQLRTLSDKEVINIYHSYLDNIEVLCQRKLRLGKPGDGGWEVCDDYEFRPIEPCVIYSFGIKNDFSFDDEAAVLYGCKVYSFDPSMGQESYQRSSNVFFYNLGLGGKAGALEPRPAKHAERQKWKVRSFSDLRAMLQHQQTPLDIVKMDIEESEWISLPDMVTNGELTSVRQLLVEFHLTGNVPSVVRKRLAVLKQIEDLGFKRFHSHMNPISGDITGLTHDYPVRRTTCYEVYFLNSNFVRDAKTSDKQ